MTKNGEIPFSVQDLEGMCGKEFYLVVQRADHREDMDKRIAGYQRERESSFRFRVLRAVQTFAYALVGRSVPQTPREEIPEGILLEVGSRKPHVVDCYHIDDVAHVRFEDGSSVNQRMKKGLQGYVFVLDRVDRSAHPPMIYGIAREHEMHDDTLAPEASRMVIHLSKVPTYKGGLGMIGCL